MGRYFLPRPSASSRTRSCSSPTATRTRSSEDRVQTRAIPTRPNEYEHKVPLSSNQVQSQDDNNRAKDRGRPERERRQGAGLAHPRGRGRRRAQQPVVAGPDHRRLRPGRLRRQRDVRHLDATTSIAWPDFSDLEEAMREAAFQLCAPVDHRAQARRPHAGPRHRRPRPRAGLGHDGDRRPGARRGGCCRRPASARRATQTTDANGFATFQWTTAAPTNSTGLDHRGGPRRRPARVRERPVGDVMRRRGPRTRPVTCRFRSRRRRTGSATTVTHESIATCRMVNRVPPAPSIEIEKATNGTDADDAARAGRPGRRPGRVDLPRDEHRQRHALEHRRDRRPGRRGHLPAAGRSAAGRRA